MSTRKIVISVDEFYHIYSRGVDKRTIFLDEKDRKRFVRLLYICNGTRPVVYKTIQTLPLEKIEVGEKLVAIGAYCLMPNHFHLLLKEITEGGIVKFMSKLLTSYSKYFNKKHERTGSLFGSEFKSEHLDSDEYLKYIFSYIHLNPVKKINLHWEEKGIHNIKETIDFLKAYQYSSFLEYMGIDRSEKIILEHKAFPDYFSEERSFESMIQDWSEYKDFGDASAN